MAQAIRLKEKLGERAVGSLRPVLKLITTFLSIISLALKQSQKSSLLTSSGLEAISFPRVGPCSFCLSFANSRPTIHSQHPIHPSDQVCVSLAPRIPVPLPVSISSSRYAVFAFRRLFPNRALIAFLPSQRPDSQTIARGLETKRPSGSSHRKLLCSSISPTKRMRSTSPHRLPLVVRRFRSFRCCRPCLRWWANSPGLQKASFRCGNASVSSLRERRARQHEDRPGGRGRPCNGGRSEPSL
jgi:hypothetical protein